MSFSRHPASLVLTAGSMLALAAPGLAETYSVPGDFPTIQSAIASATVVDGDVIEVAPGTYIETINFNGKDITVRSTAGPEATIIDAFGIGRVVEFSNGETAAATLDGFTITGGVLDDNGVGMLIAASSPTILNCIIDGNIDPDETAGTGAGLHISNSSSRIESCIFRNNQTYSGGAMYMHTNTATIVDCVFENNVASGWEGGAIRSYNDSSVIEGCTFTGNTAATRWGGAIGGRDTWLDIRRCRFEDNDSMRGGAISNWEGGHWTRMMDCIFVGNTATEYGGAIYGEVATYTYNCTIVQNDAPTGPAAYNSYTHYLYNSIIWDHGGYALAGVAFAYYSNVEDGANTYNIDEDPLFLDADNGDYRLAYGSPCIDAGHNYYVHADSHVDFLGQPRLFDDPAAADIGDGYGSLEIVDMGAIESQLERVGDLFLDNPTPGIAGQINRHDVFNATPDEAVYYAYATRLGSTRLPVCGGMTLGLANAQQSGVALALGDCSGSISLDVPPFASGLTVYLQAVEPSTCRVSNVVTYTFE